MPKYKLEVPECFIGDIGIYHCHGTCPPNMENCQFRTTTKTKDMPGEKVPTFEDRIRCLSFVIHILKDARNTLMEDSWRNFHNRTLPGGDLSMEESEQYKKCAARDAMLAAEFRANGLDCAIGVLEDAKCEVEEQRRKQV